MERPASMTYRKSLIFDVIFSVCLIIAFGVHSRSAEVTAATMVSSGSYFPQGAPWTADISKASVDPQSENIINWLADNGGWGRGRMQVDFSIRVLKADATTPTVPFHPGDEFYMPDSDSIKTIPIPPGGGIEGEGTTGYECNTDENDCHLIVVDRSQGKLYEAYHAKLVKNSMTAAFVGVWDLNRVYPPSGRGEQCTSADAAGFPIAPLLFNADEIASGSINHAIRFILPNQRIRAGVYVHPATHAGAPRGPANAPPYGARLRLKASFDVSQLSEPARVVAHAMQKYGLLLADGGNIALTAQNDADTQNKYADLGFGSNDLRLIKVTDFEVLDFGKPIRVTNDCFRNK
jgi:serine/threonine-protein kinase